MAKSPKVGHHPDLGPIDGAVRVELPIDDDWRDDCRKRLAALGITQADLKAYTKASQAGISQALSTEKRQATSKHAHVISLALKVSLTARARIHLMAYEAEANGDRRLVESYVRLMEESRSLRQR